MSVQHPCSHMTFLMCQSVLLNVKWLPAERPPISCGQCSFVLMRDHLSHVATFILKWGVVHHCSSKWWDKEISVWNNILMGLCNFCWHREWGGLDLAGGKARLVGQRAWHRKLSLYWQPQWLMLQMVHVTIRSSFFLSILGNLWVWNHTEWCQVMANKMLPGMTYHWHFHYLLLGQVKPSLQCAALISI